MIIPKDTETAGRGDEASEPRDPTSHLVRGARAGASGSFAALFERFAPAVHAWASIRIGTRLRTRIEPEDLVQEVWCRAIECFGGFDAERAPFRAWLFGIANRVLARALRGLRPGTPPPAGAPPPPTPSEIPAEATRVSRKAARDEAARRLLDAAAALDSEDRELLALHGLEGRKLPEVAAGLGIGTEAAKKRWQRLRARLIAEAGLPGDVLG